MSAAAEAMAHPISTSSPEPRETFGRGANSSNAASMPRAAGEADAERVVSRSAGDDALIKELLFFGT